MEAGAVTALNASERVLQCFWDLARIEEVPRLAAVQRLVADVVSDQAEAKPQAGESPQTAPSDSPAQTALSKQRQLEQALQKCSPLMTYTLRRLARGLESSREASRQGFATALTAVLQASALPSPHHPSLASATATVTASGDATGAGKEGQAAAGLADKGGSREKAESGLLRPEQVMVLLEGYGEGGSKGTDGRDALLGRLFGLAGLVRSGLVRDAAAARPLLAALLDLGGRKGWLGEAVLGVVLELLLGGPQGAAVTPSPSPAPLYPTPPVASTGEGKAGKKKGKKGGKEAVGQENGGEEGGVRAGGWLSNTAVRQLLAEGEAGSPPLRAYLTCKPEDASPEALALALALWPYLPPDLLAASPLPALTGRPPPCGFPLATQAGEVGAVAPAAAALFDTSYLTKVLPTLRDTTSAAPRLHTLWSLLLPFLLPGFTPRQHKVGQEQGAEVGAVTVTAATPPDSQQLEVFWRLVVEQGLFTSSHQRKFLGFQLFLVMLPRLPAATVPQVFSRNFCSVLTTNLSKQDSYLHTMAKRVMERVTALCERSPDPAVKMGVSAALAQLGGMGFVKQAKARATSKLMEGLDEAAVDLYCQQHAKAFLAGEDTSGQGAAAGERQDDLDREKKVGRVRGAAVDALSAVLKQPAASEAQKLAVLRFLAFHAFCTPTSPAGSGKKLKAGKAGAAGREAASAVGLTGTGSDLDATAGALAAGAPALSPATRQLCAQRLLATVTVTATPSAASEQPLLGKRKAGHPGANGDVADQEGQAGKLGKGNDGKAQAQAQATSAVPKAANSHHPVSHQDPSHFLVKVLDSLRAWLPSAGKGPASMAAGPLSEEADAGLTLLRDMEDALVPMATQSSMQTSNLPENGKQQQPAVARALLHLVLLLQLHVMALPEQAPDASLLVDLRRSVQQATGAQLPDVALSGDDDDEAPTGEAPTWSELLLDVLLALLSRPCAPLPSTPLRTACEAVWRATCGSLTMAGLQDLLHVVVAEAGTRRPGGDDDGVLVREDEESDGDDESEVEEEVDASDEDGGDSSGDDEPAKATPAVAAGSKRKADEDADSDETSSDSSGDEDTEEYDDEAMFRMDDKIVAYLKAAAAAKAEPQEAAAALVALKFRALSLLEVFARKVPSSPLLLAAGLPLLRGLVAACRPQAPAGAPSGNPLLAERLGSVLVKTVCKAKPTYSAAILPPAAPATATPAATASQGAEEPGTASGPEVTLDSVMRKVCHLAARAEDKRVAAAAVAVLGMQLCCCSAPQAPEPVKELCSSSLVWLVHDWCHHKACRLSLVAMKQLWARAGNAASSGPVMAALLKEAAGGARNAFTQVQAMELLAAHLRHVVSQPRTPATSLTHAQADTPAAAKPASSVQGKAAATVAATAAAAAAEGEQAAHPLLLVLKPHAKSLGSVLAAAAGGAGMKAEHHLDALRAAVQVVEAVRKVCTEAGKKLAVLVGAEWLNAVAKAVVTVRELGVSDRVNTQLSRLIQVMGIAELVAVAQPDPALKMRLAKAQAARAEAASKPKNGVTQERAAKHVESKARSASAAAAKGGAAASPRTKKQKAPATGPGRTGKHAKRVPDAHSGGAAPAAKLSKHAHKAAKAQQEAQDVGVNGGSAVKSKKAKVAKS